MPTKKARNYRRRTLRKINSAKKVPLPHPCRHGARPSISPFRVPRARAISLVAIPRSRRQDVPARRADTCVLGPEA